ncbi:MAG: acyl-CoA carboxylase subunit beta [Proteobacteria bacterium]|nr:acyl-CoA carboxylase subunit beta [Pseudomonadota bacterium]
MSQELHPIRERIVKGGAQKYHDKNTESKKLFARNRIALLCDKGTFVEDGLFANCMDNELPADGVITGLGKIGGRAIALMANDSTVKAGSWGARTVEKIVRIQEVAEKLQIPLFYLVDSAGARITDQVEMFPGRRGAGRIFRNQARLSGIIPQICLLFGPSAAGGAYIPAFCDVLFMVEGNASMYLGSPRMAEAVIGEKVSLEEMGGAKMHCTQSGCGDFLCATEEMAIEKAKRYFSYLPQNRTSCVPIEKSHEPEFGPKELQGLIPESDARAYDMKQVIKTIVDKDSFCEVKELFAKEVITGFGRLDGKTIAIVANQPLVKGGVLFVDSSDKAARFIQIASSYGIPILFIADVPGFMIGSKVEKEGMIRSGAKFIYAMSNADVPKISLIVRKAYGAGLYAMCGPAFDCDATIALPSAKIAVMGPEPAINAVYANKIQELPVEERKAFMTEKMKEYETDVNIYKLASELIVDQMVDYSEVRSELMARFSYYALKNSRTVRPSGILPM